MTSAKLLKTARMLRGWDQADLAKASGISTPTIQRMEKLGPERSSMLNVQKVLDAFTAAGITFIDNEQGVGVVLKETS